MSYKLAIGRVRDKLKELRKLAESDGWGTGHHISKYLSINQLTDYYKLLGREDGMKEGRRLTMIEHKSLSTQAHKK